MNASSISNNRNSPNKLIEDEDNDNDKYSINQISVNKYEEECYYPIKIIYIQ